MAGLIPRTRTIAVVDIGAGYVGCALIALRQSGASSVIAHGHSLLSLEKRSDEQARARVPEEIAQAVKAAQDAAGVKIRGKHIADVRIVLHAPWSTSTIASAQETYQTRTHIQASHISTLAKQSLSAGGADNGNLFERSVISIKLNGYPTSAPEGKQAQSVEIAAILSRGDPALTKSIETALLAVFPAAHLSWLSAEHVYTHVMSRLGFPEDALIIDVGIQATHLIVLQGSVPSTDRVVSDGLHGILERVHGVDAPQETLALFRMLARDACQNDACEALRKAVAMAEPEIVKLIGESLVALAASRRLPNTFVLITHADIVPWLSSFFERIDFSQFTLTMMPLAARAIEPVHYATYLRSDDQMESALALACVHAAIEEQST